MAQIRVVGRGGTDGPDVSAAGSPIQTATGREAGGCNGDGAPQELKGTGFARRRQPALTDTGADTRLALSLIHI